MSDKSGQGARVAPGRVAQGQPHCPTAGARLFHRLLTLATAVKRVVFVFVALSTLGLQTLMPKTRQELMARLEELGIAVTTVDHKAVFTVGESDELHAQIQGGHTKNLFLKDAKDKLWLVIAECHTSIDLKALPKTIGSARLSFGKAELLMEALGVTPGSVTALSLINDTEHRVSVVVDQRLMEYDMINCHPLVNTATTSIRRDDLVRFIEACGHTPRILTLTATGNAG